MNRTNPRTRGRSLGGRRSRYRHRTPLRRAALSPFRRDRGVAEVVGQFGSCMERPCGRCRWQRLRPRKRISDAPRQSGASSEIHKSSRLADRQSLVVRREEPGLLPSGQDAAGGVQRRPGDVGQILSPQWELDRRPVDGAVAGLAGKPQHGMGHAPLGPLIAGSRTAPAPPAGDGR